MNRSSLSFVIRSCTLAALLHTVPTLSSSQETPEVDLLLISPFPGYVAVSKTPKISFRSSQPLMDEGLLVLLDGNDITALISRDNGVFSYIPLDPLAAGQHSLYVIAAAEDGTPVEKELGFSSRQSESFEEIYSDNRVSATLKTALAREFSSGTRPTAGPAIDFPYTSFDAYLTTDSLIKEGRWDSSARANIRYYDQNAALLAPEKKWLSLLDFLIAASYEGDSYTALAELGDTTIEESRNTIDYLARRGGKASISVGNVTLNGFSVLGDASGYELEGLGFGFNSNDTIMGTSIKVDFFDQQMSLKGIYSRGGEEGNGLGTWSEAGGRTGDVTGIVLMTDFFSQLLTTEFEFDTVNYDHDNGDDEDNVYDKAYRIQIGGLTEIYDYEVSYSYTGPQYDVVGNPSIIRDWAGFDFTGAINYPTQILRLLMNYSWDNVEDDDLYATIHSFTGGIDYQYNGWQQFPINLIFDYNRQRSTDEPIDIESTALDTSTLSGSIGYFEGPWAVELRSSYSEQNDKTFNDFDTKLFTLSVVPSYTNSFFSILPSWTLNSSRDLASELRTDINTLTLDTYSSFMQDTVSCEIGGTYDWATTNDDSVDFNNTALYGRLNYHFSRLWQLEDSVIGLEYRYNRQEDNIFDATFSENSLTLVISSAIPYSF